MQHEIAKIFKSLDLSTGEILPVIGTVVGVFLGAYLALTNERRIRKNIELEKNKDLLVRVYRQNSVNLQILLTYKNSFLSEFNYGFFILEEFLKKYVDARPREKVYLRDQWHIRYRDLTRLSSKYAEDSSSDIYRERWEKPELLSFDLQEVASIAKKSPDILGVTMYLSSAITLLQEELSMRARYAEKISEYAGNIPAVYLPQDDFAKDLFRLFTCRSHIHDCLERAISLSFGLSALLESHYRNTFGKIDFHSIVYSKETLSKITSLDLFQNFFGHEKNFFLIKTRYERAINVANGHKELNKKTSIMDSRF